MLGIVLTSGVDLSAEDTRTCMATIEWAASAATVVELRTKVSNAVIVESAHCVTKAGIDCPFGWPVPFVEFVAGHDRGDARARPGRPAGWRRELANRATDLYVREQTSLIPLSVSADRIGHVAMRCAALLADLTAAGLPVDRTGQAGKVVEVYPAASLFRWELPYRSYKGTANLPNLNQLVNALRAAAPWLDLGMHEAACRSSDDAFDAVIAAMTARASALGQTIPPASGQARLAAREGWIALPLEGSLDQLTRPGDSP
jgi:predicted nuclease with RNAse H fold